MENFGKIECMSRDPHSDAILLGAVINITTYLYEGRDNPELEDWRKNENYYYFEIDGNGYSLVDFDIKPISPNSDRDVIFHIRFLEGKVGLEERESREPEDLFDRFIFVSGI